MGEVAVWKDAVLLTRVPAVGAGLGGGGPAGSGAKSGLADRTIGNFGWGRGAVWGPVCMVAGVAGVIGARAVAAALAARTASSRWAFLSSGFWFRLARISLREAPTMALWNLVFLLVRFLAASSTTPFLCLRLYSTVQVTLRGFLFKR